MSAPDTADRSLAHWSEAGRSEMEAFYALARLDYEMLAGVLDWRALLGSLAERAGGHALTLLDVACGSGKFPEALVTYAGVEGLAPLRYDLLDPSAFSLQEAVGVLRGPFVAGRAYETTIEDLAPAAGPWDVVWATHALYALAPTNVPAAVARLVAARGDGGLAFLAQGSADGFYLSVYRAFLEGVRDGTPYVAADDLIAELRDQGVTPEVRRIAYDHVVAVDDTAVLEGYLQRCVFDDTLGLDAMLAAPVLGPLLNACRDDAAGVYRFRQEVDCVVIGPGGADLPWTIAP